MSVSDLHFWRFLQQFKLKFYFYSTYTWNSLTSRADFHTSFPWEYFPAIFSPPYMTYWPTESSIMFLVTHLLFPFWLIKCLLWKRSSVLLDIFSQWTVKGISGWLWRRIFTDSQVMAFPKVLFDGSRTCLRFLKTFHLSFEKASSVLTLWWGLPDI